MARLRIWRPQQRDEEIKGRSAGQGEQPGEGCGQSLRVKADPTNNAASVGEGRGEPTVVAAGGGREGSMWSSMVISHGGVVELQDLNPKVETDCGSLHKIDLGK